MTRSGGGPGAETRWVSRPDQPGVKTLFRLLAVCALAALVASCGSPVVPPSGNPTTSTTTAGRTTVPTITGTAAGTCGVVASAEVAVTDGTEPCRVSTHIGVLIAIVLDPGFDWDTPASDSSAIEVANVVRQSSGRLDADLIAAQVGQATVSAAGAVLCPAEHFCPALARLWRLHVTVGP